MAEDQDFVYLKSAVRAEMFKRTTYDLDLKLDQHGHIEEAQCECTAGAGPSCHCKHMRALLLAVLDQKQGQPMLLELTCTEQLQSFHKPRQAHKGSPIKSAELNLPKANADALIFDPIPVEFQESDETVRDRTRNATINLAANTGIRPPMMHLIPPANVHGVVMDHDYMEMTLADKILHSDNMTAISPATIDAIEEGTRAQSGDASWFHERSKRLTSSNFGKICKLTDKANKVQFTRNLMSTRKISSQSLEHGRKYEPVAVHAFEQKYNVSVQKSGLIVCREFPYLACSPDGLIGDDTILEVKCPSASKNRPINSATVPYLKSKSDGTLCLMPNHDYMYQIQGCMYITGRSKCKFVVYTLTDMLVLDILYDADFVNDMLPKLKTFFENHFKIEYLNRNLFRESHLYSI